MDMDNKAVDSNSLVEKTVVCADGVCRLREQCEGMLTLLENCEHRVSR